MNDHITPLEAGLEWTLAMKDARKFIGRDALETQIEQTVPRKLSGIVLDEGRGGVLRAHYKVITNTGKGEITSGTFSPTLLRTIGFALVPKESTTCQVEIRGKLLQAKFCSKRFLHEWSSLQY